VTEVKVTGFDVGACEVDTDGAGEGGVGIEYYVEGTGENPVGEVSEEDGFS